MQELNITQSFHIRNTCTTGYIFKTNVLQETDTKHTETHDQELLLRSILNTIKFYFYCECGHTERSWRHLCCSSKPKQTQSQATCSKWPCLSRQVGLDHLKSPFQPKYFQLIWVTANTCSSFRRLVGSQFMPSLFTDTFSPSRKSEKRYADQ